MSDNFALSWNQSGKKTYQTGADRAVLYPMTDGKYDVGEAWEGFSKFTEKPTGAEPTKFYANNGTYITGYSIEEFEGDIEAFTYPEGFKACNGESELVSGITIGQQERKTFGFCYRNYKGNDAKGSKYGYIIHIVYGAKVQPAEVEHETINDSFTIPAMSWSIATTPVYIDKDHNPTATLNIDSTVVDADKLAEFEKIIYGTAADGDTAVAAARLPLPAEIIEFFGATA